MMERLTPQEEQAMIAIWHHGRGFIKDFIDRISPVPHYNTLVSTVKNLEKKGYVSSSKIGNVYQYWAAVEEADYTRQFMTNVVKNHFDNSYKDLVSFFAEQNKISSKDLKEIIDMIEAKKK